MSIYKDIGDFVQIHRPHGELTWDAGDLTPHGYRVEIACRCGVTFERWVLPQDAAEGLLAEAIRRLNKPLDK